MKTKNYSPTKIRSASFNADENTIDIVWSTGADVVREDWDGPYIERLLMGDQNVRLDRLNNGAPLLNTHSSDTLGDVIGVIVSGTARIENGKGIATVKLSSAGSDSDTITKIREGVIRNISVGYWTHAQTRSDDSTPVVTATDWEPLEISAVPIPADPGAQFRSLRGSRSARKPLSKEDRNFAQGAATATRLLGRASPLGRYRMESARPATLDKAGIDRGARAARRLLRKT